MTSKIGVISAKAFRAFRCPLVAGRPGWPRRQRVDPCDYQRSLAPGTRDALERKTRCVVWMAPLWFQHVTLSPTWPATRGAYTNDITLHKTKQKYTVKNVN